MNSKERLDSLIGISDGETIDDFLNGLSVEKESLKEATERIDSAVKDKINEIDTALAQQPESNLDVKNLEKNFGEISELITLSKSIISHLYDNVVNTSLIDPELINATATFIEVAHRNIKEYIDLYKERLRFFDKVRYEMLQHQNKKELVELKHKFAMEKMAQDAQHGGTPQGMYKYKQEDAIEMLAEIDAMQEGDIPTMFEEKQDDGQTPREEA